MPGTLQDYAQAVHDVISTNRDAEQGYRGAAQAVNDSAMKALFLEYAAERAGFVIELQTAVKALGFDPIDPQGLGGMLRASWMSVKGMVTGHDVHGILVEVERAEDSSVSTYRIALSKAMTPEIATIVERQFEELQVAHDRIRELRDSTAPPPDPEPVQQPAAPASAAPASGSNAPSSVSNAPASVSNSTVSVPTSPTPNSEKTDVPKGI
jgi:uncharacterized protein (TIGR02284 family)